MRKSIRLATLLAALAMTACATRPHRPVVDAGVSRGDYEGDVAECQHLADQRPAASDVAGGAAIGAVFGALFGLAAGLRGDDVAGLAAIGAATWAIDDAATAGATQRTIVARCMDGRGYTVLAD